MKRYLILVCIALLSACRPLDADLLTSTPIEETNPVSSTPTKLSGPQIPSFTITYTSVPSETPFPTETLTQIPPKSFDPTVIQTFTPATPAECPKENSNIELDVEGLTKLSGFVEPNQQITENLLAFLNSGGTLNSILSAHESYYGSQIDHSFKIQDITGDNLPELIYPFGIWIDVFGCEDGKYELLFTDIYESGNGGVDIIEVSDINLDGLAEVIVYFSGCMGSRCPTIRVYEWNGKNFQNLIVNPNNIADGCSSLTVAPYDVEARDIDTNGTKEIIMSNSRLPQPDNDFPYRKETRICMWNGQNIVVYKNAFDAPYYRFQAVQDGDRATLSGDYSEAMGFYQRTINDKHLQWFTEERKWHDFWVYHSEYFPSAKEPTPTASPSLVQDPNEYPILAAYAYYRIMLVHILQNDSVKAETTLSTLKGEFPAGSPGNYFTQVASIFWQEHNISRNVQNSCKKVVEYVQEHPLPTEYLGDWDHGAHSIRYVPESVCPFR
jgi:hypothetical protein